MSSQFRTQFGFFSEQGANQRRPEHCVYLDSAATTQKLDSVIAKVSTFTQAHNASVHRSAYPLANQATTMFEAARDSISSLINANDNEIIFTSGATESLNLIAQGITKRMLSGNTILICESEHHANIFALAALS